MTSSTTQKIYANADVLFNAWMGKGEFQIFTEMKKEFATNNTNNSDDDDEAMVLVSPADKYRTHLLWLPARSDRKTVFASSVWQNGKEAALESLLEVLGRGETIVKVDKLDKERSDVFPTLQEVLSQRRPAPDYTDNLNKRRRWYQKIGGVLGFS